jgi:ABC transporter with metal-binding/Fe-S-binding domain ATP-binding protein
MKSKKCAVLFSGGKDSCLALHMALKKSYDVRCLLSIIPKNFDSFMFHKPYLNLLGEQAEMLDIDLIVKESEGIEEEEVDDLKDLISQVKGDVDVIVVGGIASSYQGKRIKSICDEWGLEFYAPLWDYKSEDVWKELFNEGFKVILTKVSCDGLDRGWVGEVIDKERFEELRGLSEKYRFRIDFEGGEAESAVLDMPEFKKEIKLKFNVKSEGEHRHYLEDLEVI